MILFDYSKKVYQDDFRKALREISALSPKERAYVEEVFKGDLSGGLTRSEIEMRCGQLKHKTGDPLEPSEVMKIREKLLKYFD